MTSCRVSRSISSMRSISKAPFSQTARACLLGDDAERRCASQACASISNQNAEPGSSPPRWRHLGTAVAGESSTVLPVFARSEAYSSRIGLVVKT